MFHKHLLLCFILQNIWNFRVPANFMTLNILYKNKGIIFQIVKNLKYKYTYIGYVKLLSFCRTLFKFAIIFVKIGFIYLVTFVYSSYLLKNFITAFDTYKSVTFRFFYWQRIWIHFVNWILFLRVSDIWFVYM